MTSCILQKQSFPDCRFVFPLNLRPFENAHKSIKALSFATIIFHGGSIDRSGYFWQSNLSLNYGFYYVFFVTTRNKVQREFHKTVFCFRIMADFCCVIVIHDGYGRFGALRRPTKLWKKRSWVIRAKKVWESADRGK